MSTPNVQQAVPFFMVHDVEASVQFYVERLGFELTDEGRPDSAQGRLQWCWLQLGGAALMLQGFPRESTGAARPRNPVGHSSGMGCG